ncbi:lipoprotein [Spiroplasma endosymbiont of Seladonia tumulorum]|uniref:lipoprotein n=1 Tax=Spiroplasma endosymbiont of Seladonia tumulorum TaxID=3066321 RepID=UPI0030CF8280
MKRLLSILGAITLVGTSTTSLVACNKPQYSEDELKKEKEKHKIDTKDQTIKNNLEWMASQEKPFDNVDNKYYYVVWRGNKNDSWRLIKFQNNQQDKLKNKDEYDNYKLALVQDLDWNNTFDLTIQKNNLKWIFWHKDIQYFKAVYRWNLEDTQEPNLILDENNNIKVNGE